MNGSMRDDSSCLSEHLSSVLLSHIFLILCITSTIGKRQITLGSLLIVIIILASVYFNFTLKRSKEPEKFEIEMNLHEIKRFYLNYYQDILHLNSNSTALADVSILNKRLKILPKTSNHFQSFILNNNTFIIEKIQHRLASSVSFQNEDILSNFVNFSTSFFNYYKIIIDLFPNVTNMTMSSNATDSEAIMNDITLSSDSTWSMNFSKIINVGLNNFNFSNFPFGKEFMNESNETSYNVTEVKEFVKIIENLSDYVYLSNSSLVLIEMFYEEMKRQLLAKQVEEFISNDKHLQRLLL
jgi:hypothetical protein